MMRIKQAESGQVMPTVALLMVVIIGMAAFAIDASNVYSQHRRVQADLDVAIKVAGANMFDFNPSDPAYDTTAKAAILSAAQLLAKDGYANSIASIPTYYRSGSGWCASTATSTPVSLTICTPPRSPSPWQGSTDAVEGTLSEDVTGFFGGVLGLNKLHVSVHATAKHGGYYNPFAIIGLDTASGDCSIGVQNTAAYLMVRGSIHSNAQTCIKNGTAVISGTVEAVAQTDNSNGTSMTGISGTVNGGGAVITNPYSVTFPSATQPAVTMCTSGCTYTSFVYSSSNPLSGVLGYSAANTCLANLKAYVNPAIQDPPPSGVTYYFPPDLTSPNPSPTGQTAEVTGFDQSQGEFDFFPHCDEQPPSVTGAITGPTPGIYYFNNNPITKADIKLSGSATINSYDAAFTFANNNTLIDETGTNGSSSTVKWSLNAPAWGPLQGMAIYEQQPCAGTNPSMTLVGGTSSLINGIVDVGCASVTVSGNSIDDPFINGQLIGWQITLAGSGTAIVNYDPSAAPPDKGSVLVE